jgi:xylulose-5-phosphate/fructose-6-phosphate phosphoketolase
MVNERDRLHLAGDAVDRVPKIARVGGHFKQVLRNKLIEHKGCAGEHGDDLREIRHWKWPRR